MKRILIEIMMSILIMGSMQFIFHGSANAQEMNPLPPPEIDVIPRSWNYEIVPDLMNGPIFYTIFGDVLFEFPPNTPPATRCIVRLHVNSTDVPFTTIGEMTFDIKHKNREFHTTAEIDSEFEAGTSLDITIEGTWEYAQAVGGGDVEEVHFSLDFLPFSRIDMELQGDAPRILEKGKWETFNITLENMGNSDDVIKLEVKNPDEDVRIEFSSDSVALERFETMNVTCRILFTGDEERDVIARLSSRGIHGGPNGRKEVILAASSSIPSGNDERTAVWILLLALLLVLIISLTLLLIIGHIEKRKREGH